MSATGASVHVGPVLLLGVNVTVTAELNHAEHVRRCSVGLGAVTDPALLDRLLDLPIGIAVPDPVIWAETAQVEADVIEPGVLERADDGQTVRRLLVSPLTIRQVTITAKVGREMHAVSEASAFAEFTRSQVALHRRRTIPEQVMLEAQLFGVGLTDARGTVVLPAEPPTAPTRDGWAWLLEEKTYRAWLA